MLKTLDDRGPTKLHKSLGYFPAVDGLRAVAVATVMLFHLDASLLPGGFVGVDIFFVISGFVVTASLAHLHFPSFPRLLAYFYARRLTRIMPALCVCLLVTIFAYVLLIPRSWLSNLTEDTAVAAFLGFSNFVLARNNDSYFAPTSEYNPFLHTWSLGVEEQFYLVFPFLLFFHGMARASAVWEKRSLLFIVAAGIFSFAICGFLAFYKAKYSFYLLPARFWELALGMVLALTFTRWQSRLKTWSARSIDGLALLTILILALSIGFIGQAHFPFPMALFPAIGAALCIALVCAVPGHWAGKGLASAPILWIGLRSYSLYLWHWPVYVLMRWTVGLETVPMQIAAVGLTAVLADLSYRFVEQPLRKSSALKGMARWKVAFGGLAVAGLATLGGAALLRGQPAISISKTAAADEWYTTGDNILLAGPAGCRLVSQQRSLADGSISIWTREGCAAPAKAGRLFVIGNSHALSYVPMLRQFALDTGHEVRLYFRSGCPYIPLNQAMTQLRNCTAFFGAATRAFMAELTPRDILFMPSMRLDQGVDQWGEKREFTNPARSRAAMAEAGTLLADLAGKSSALLVFEAPKPLLPSPVYRCADWYMRLNPLCAGGLAVSRTEMERKRTPVIRQMQDLGAGNDRVEIWDPLPTLCGPTSCGAFDGEKPIFFDRHHISTHGNRMLRGRFEADFSQWFGDPRPATAAGLAGHTRRSTPEVSAGSVLPAT